MEKACYREIENAIHAMHEHLVIAEELADDGVSAHNELRKAMGYSLRIDQLIHSVIEQEIPP